MENLTLPSNLISTIGWESKDFVVKAWRAQPMRSSLFTIGFGLVWTVFSSIFVFAFLGPLFMGNEVHFKTNGVLTVASPDNLGPIVVPAITMGVFVLIGLVMFWSGIYSLFKKWGYFVGTPTRLVHYRNWKIRSIDWEQFSGDIEVNWDPMKWNIVLTMRTGKIVSRKNAPDKYVPDVIYISAIPNVFEIEQICRKRIKENDPTPSIKQSI